MEPVVRACSRSRVCLDDACSIHGRDFRTRTTGARAVTHRAANAADRPRRTPRQRHWRAPRFAIRVARASGHVHRRAAGVGRVRTGVPELRRSGACGPERGGGRPWQPEPGSNPRDRRALRHRARVSGRERQRDRLRCAAGARAGAGLTQSGHDRSFRRVRQRRAAVLSDGRHGQPALRAALPSGCPRRRGHDLRSRRSGTAPIGRTASSIRCRSIPGIHAPATSLASSRISNRHDSWRGRCAPTGVGQPSLLNRRRCHRSFPAWAGPTIGHSGSSSMPASW